MQFWKPLTPSCGSFFFVFSLFSFFLSSETTWYCTHTFIFCFELRVLWGSENNNIILCAHLFLFTRSRFTVSGVGFSTFIVSTTSQQFMEKRMLHGFWTCYTFCWVIAEENKKLQEFTKCQNVNESRNSEELNHGSTQAKHRTLPSNTYANILENKSNICSSISGTKLCKESGNG